MGFGSFCSTSRRWCYSTEVDNEYTNNYYHNIYDEKMIPDCLFYHIVMIVKNIQFTNNVCSYQFIHELSLSCDVCRNYVITIIVVLNITLHVQMSVM